MNIAVEMVGLADGKSREKLAVPLRIGIHVGVNAQFQTGFHRLKGRWRVLRMRSVMVSTFPDLTASMVYSIP